MFVRTVSVAAVALVVSSLPCSAQVVYEAITGRTLNSVFVPDSTTEHAQELRLAGSGATSIDSVQMLFRNIGSTVSYQGRVSLALYEGAGGLPGSLIAMREFNVGAPAGADLLLHAPLDGSVAMNRTIWLSFNISPNALGGPAILGVRESLLPPNVPVGSAAGWTTRRPVNTATWLATQPPIVGGSAWAIRVAEVPGPSACGVVAIAGLMGMRRRRVG